MYSHSRADREAAGVGPGDETVLEVLLGQPGGQREAQHGQELDRVGQLLEPRPSAPGVAVAYVHSVLEAAQRADVDEREVEGEDDALEQEQCKEGVRGAWM